MANYDDVVEKNKRYLTQAQINALAEASKQYNIQNAGNRAGALASAREQFDTGYRGLQNMGLAGATPMQPTSGEVPRLVQDIRTPFDDYNRRLNDVEHRRLDALGGQFAQQTQAARAAAQQAERARQETLQQQYQRAQAAARAINVKSLPSAPKLNPRDLVRESVKEFDEPTPKAKAETTAKEATQTAFANAGLQMQKSVARAQDIAAASLLGISAPANRAIGAVERALEPITNKMTGVEHTVDDARAAETAKAAFKHVINNIKANDTTKELEAANDAVKQAQATVDRVKNLQASGSRSDTENAKEFYSDEEKQANENLRYAKQAEQLAKLKAEDPVTYAFLTVATSDMDPATKRAAGKQFVDQGFKEDEEDNARKYENARISFSRMQNAWQQHKEEKPGPKVEDVEKAAKRVLDAAEWLASAKDNSAYVPNAVGTGEDELRNATKALRDLGFYTPEDALDWAEGKNAVPENLQAAYDDMIEKEFRYKEPEAYKAAQVLQYRGLLKDTNPEVIEWANDKISDYKLKAMGIKTPDMSNDVFSAAKEKVKGVREIMNRIESARIAQDSKAKTNTPGEVDYWQQDIDELTKELQTEYGMTEQEASDFLAKYDADRDARSEYNYYKPGMVALLEHQGEHPTQPVNTKETDPVYRRINGLSNITMAASEYEGAESNNVAKWMTPEQKNAYNAIYEKEGIAAANEYFDEITPFLNIQRAMEDEKKYKELADKHPFITDLRSVGANLLWNIPATIERLAVGTANLFSDEQIYYDPKSEMSYRAPRADIIRSERSQNILNNTNRSDRMNSFLNFAYQTGMSMADSATAMAFAYAGAPWMVDALFFSSAGNAAYRDAKEKGATQSQAMAVGILSGAAEAIFEHASIEHFMKLDYKGKGALIKNLLSQATAEGSEEVTTEIANMLTDAWVMRDKSEYNQKVKEYVSQGMSLDKAENKAFLDQLASIGMAGLGGVVSGALFGLGGALVSSVKYNKEGKRLKNSPFEMNNIIENAELLGGESQEALNAYNADKSNRNLGELSATVNKAIYDLFGGEKATTLNKDQTGANLKENVVDKATATAAILSGEKMTVNGADAVMKAMGEEDLQKMGYDTSSAKAFAQDYNQRLQTYSIQSRATSVTKIAQTFVERENAMKTANAGELSARQAAQRFASNQSYLRGDTYTAAGSYAQSRQQARNEANITAAKTNAENRVWANPTQGLTQTVDGRTVTPMPGNLTAVAFAEQQRNNFKANATARTGNVTYAVSGMQARDGLTNDQTLSEIKKGLTKEARNKAEVYEKLSKALGLKLTIHDVMVGTNGFIDENGNMHVVLSGRQSVLRVAAHELTHYMKDHAGTHYSALREHLIKDVGQATFDRMIARKALEYGIDLSTETGRTVADDEVCAELCERMLANEDALEKFAEKNTAAAKMLKDHLLKILNAIKAALKDKRNRDFGDSWSDLIKSQETIESWVEGLQEAIKNADARAQTNEGQIGKVAGVTIADQNDLIDDIKSAKTDAEVDDAINEHSVDVIEYDMAGYAEDLFKAGMSQNDITVLFDTMNKAIDKVKAHRAILDYGAELSTDEEVLEAKKNRAYLPYKQNADPHYKLALDFSTLCRKRVLLQTIQERLQAKMGRATTQEETVAIRLALQKLQREGYKVEVACALCYVEAARLKSPKVINAFLNNTANEMRNYFAKKNPESKAIIEGLQQQWKVDHGLAPDATKADMKAAGVNVTEYNNYSRDLREQFEGNDSEETIVARALDLVKNHRNVFLSASELTKLKKSDPDIFSAFTDKVRSATRSKAQETDTFYSRGDINMVTEAILNYANAESGFRHQSWSDFVPTHLLDTMAAVIEMSTQKAKMHAYTKVPAMVRLLGKTGMALNMSLIPSGNTGIDASGNLSFDSVEGMPWEVMMELRDMFPETAGNIAIGINGEQIQKLLASKDIDYVIPYHASGMNKNMRGYLDIRAWSEYTSSQNEKTNHRGTKGKAPELAEWFDEKAAAKATDGEAFMREASEKYLQLCYERNLTPKFAQYLQNNGDGSYSLKEGYENYWKMLTDRKMVNQKTGKVIIQQAVKPTFDQDTVLGILEDRLNDPAIQDAERAADIVTEQFSDWRADRNNADAEAIQAAKDLRDRTAAISAQKTAEAMYDLGNDTVRYSLADDDLARKLNREDTVKVYRAMQLIDGKLYPPMAAKVKDEQTGKNTLVQPTEIGQWYVSDERPDLIDPKTGTWKLDKANGSSIQAAYNPYFHTSTSPLNDQFSSAYKRDNLVVVEGSVPKSELTSGYHAQYAKDPVGAMRWHSGPVSSHLSTPRTVILSRYFKANRILSDAEVASKVAKLVEGENVSIPQNTVTPGLYAELQKLGVPTTAMYDLDLEDLAEIDNGVRHNLDTQQGGHRSPIEGERRTGYKPAGKGPRARDVNVPEVARNGKRVSDFTRSFLESNKATDEIADELMSKVESGEWGGYTRLTNEEAMNRAKDYISKVQLTKAQQDFHDMVMSGRYNVNTRALGLQLLTEAAKRGDKVAVLDIASDLRVLATDAGQSVQIFSVLKELGGVGSAWYLNKVVERLNTKYADQIAAGKMSEITVPEELMTQLEEARTTQEVTAAEKAVAKSIADQLPLTWADRLSNWRYMAMLANPTTHVRNMFGNLLMGGLNTAKDVVATGIERIGVKDKSKRTHAVLTSADRKTWNGFAEQSYKDNEGLLRGNGKFSFESVIKQNMRSFDTKALNAIAQFNFNKLEQEDMIFIRPAFKNALMQYMKAQGYTLQGGVAGQMVGGKFKAMTKAQTAQAVEYASEQAWKATFHDASALADMLNKISKMNTASRLIVEGVMPFKKTPINIAKRGIEYSPAGVVMGLVQLARNVKNGKVTTAHAIDNLASGITGTALMAVGILLSKAGFIRVGDDDDKKLATYKQDTGDQTYSLKIGNYSFSLSALAPATIPLFMGAALNEMVSKNGDELDLSAITDTIAGTLNPFMEMSFMSSLNSALKNYGSEGIGGALGNTILTSAENYFSQYLPTVTGKLGQLADPTLRTTKSSATSPIGSGMDYYLRSLAKKVPGLEAALQPDVNVWGRETRKDSFIEWALDFANKFILPANVKVSNRDSVDNELMRLVESTGGTDFLPSDGAKKFTVKGDDFPMTAEQYTQFSKDRGHASYAALKETMSTDAYWDATDEEKATMLSNALSAAQKQVNTMWKEKLGAFDKPEEQPVTEEKPKTEVQSTQGDYNDPALYKVAASFPNAYDKAAKAKAKGVSPDTFIGLYGYHENYIGEERARDTRREIMNSDLTPSQKAFMDDLIVSDTGWNPDYSSQVWFDVSMLGKNQYEKAKEGEKLKITPETYLAAYNKDKEIDGAKLGKKKKPTVIEYLDSLNLSAPAYDYLLSTVFGYTTR